MPTRLERKVDDLRRGMTSLNPSALAQPIRAAPGFLPIDWFVVITESDDYVTCERRDGGGIVALAKPFQIRGATAVRTVNAENQEILPAYALNDQIYGVYMPNGVGLNFTTGVTTNTLFWLDLNVDGRYWAKSL